MEYLIVAIFIVLSGFVFYKKIFKKKKCPKCEV